MIQTRLLVTAIIIATITALMPLTAWGQQDVALALDIDASKQLPDTTQITRKVKYDWRELVKEHRFRALMNDSIVNYPKFVNFCLKVYRWADRTFNTYDPQYVQPADKPGKIRLISDNWLDMQYIRFSDGSPMVMVSSPRANLGVQANYYSLSLSYSVDLNTVFTGKKSTNRKWNLSLSCARLFLEAFLWQNDGKTKIRDFGANHITGNYDFKGIPFEGLSFKSYGVLGLYVFNNKKFSLMSGYNMSPVQKKSQGSWLLGLSGTFYDIDFNFYELPPAVAGQVTLPYSNYRFDYNTVCVIGGYSYNWVMGRHWLFNVTMLPALGVTFSFDSSTAGRRELLAAAVRQNMSLTYTTRQFFVNFSSKFHGNLFLTSNVGFMSGVENFQLSAGVRF